MVCRPGKQEGKGIKGKKSREKEREERDAWSRFPSDSTSSFLPRKGREQRSEGGTRIWVIYLIIFFLFHPSKTKHLEGRKLKYFHEFLFFFKKK